ncbi:2,3,4,5-tetrahydropyridine-2,6-dicarboxylate N-succinyltransferase [Vibrio cholerae]|jgi:2,3,4,5-tetrahydropyridine-2,6-dicarboxylate N-succinyltransferase|uniref:2,3,4,5-tetrahydropyridine-2,6-dicarboxylate N-succinyltransferase n=2 Tax=Vibrio TaxID=662 RepID=A0A5C9SU07_VIBCL|nr:MULTISPECIES: 2,3,4,5-tetrahydropyridine-2,6-dicarboxylate N-succinyltransferase [Vibrio]EGQ8492239.1 2,3,4,5-tetrahydropyridine-2,6-dicarboxylate N-succinyltransferase [Vibrio cholerae]EGR0603567.1 2,3,4,5-tetrahydropyridine-2,6-dicarboxylate N-succinyltransferase [Vibrio cholerae]EGR1126952.1 2,3,4,5-tetrahydropyridine-2,6-dicarboxylate N-succinyltransferase [Vibrio cholerae]EGR3931073.1 2,3,4,5-tetrahydropyridine-2,6-dicarboxylate N-succinyltransferase [Vibrio cholerae]EJL6760075.1 2,3,4
MAYFALGLATATKNRDGKIIEAFFPTPILAPSDALVAALAPIAGYQEGNQALEITAAQSAQLAAVFTAHQQAASAAFADKAANAKQPLVLVILASDDKPQSVAEGYLKLQLISHRLVKPHGTVLDGIFGLLHNIAWTNEGPIDLPELAERQIEARLAGRVLTVDCVDKFPKMVDYVVPAGIRIADTSRVRLGAHVGEGTTVMHEGFINFNAGTTGVSMVEGRISAGVVVGNGSDIGGGASIMGTLSGGGKVVVSIGENSLLGANAGLGFPLGDRCTVESGLYVTAGTKVRTLDKDGNQVDIVKARDLAGVSDLLFRRNSLTGQIECLANKSAVELNSELHKNN